MTTTTTFNNLDLSDKPFDLELIVQKKVPWSRQLKIFDSKTKLVIPMDGKTFFGSIIEFLGGPVVVSYTFAVNTTTDTFTVSLSSANIDLLDISKVYLHDWLYVEAGVPVKVMTGTIRAQATFTTIP